MGYGKRRDCPRSNLYQLDLSRPAIVRKRLDAFFERVEGGAVRTAAQGAQARLEIWAIVLRNRAQAAANCNEVAL